MCQQGSITCVGVCRFPLSFGKKHSDSIVCEVVDVDLYDIVLGKPWLFDVGAIRRTQNNSYEFMWEKAKIILIPSPKPKEEAINMESSKLEAVGKGSLLEQYEPVVDTILERDISLIVPCQYEDPLAKNCEARPNFNGCSRDYIHLTELGFKISFCWIVQKHQFKSTIQGWHHLLGFSRFVIPMHNSTASYATEAPMQGQSSALYLTCLIRCKLETSFFAVGEPDTEHIWGWDNCFQDLLISWISITFGILLLGFYSFLLCLSCLGKF